MPKKLFMSYASEDRAYALQLRDALSLYYAVWIDEDKLQVGDSLFAHISEGLAKCDFGVVVLSPHFVTKTWPLRELGGLMALEEKSKKMILPVWKDIGVTEVKEFSPIMADKIAARAEEGLDAVVAKLRNAIESATRAIELAEKPGVSARFIALGRDLKAKAQSDALLRTTEGVHLIHDDCQRLISEIVSTLKAAETDLLKFNVKVEGRSLIANTVARISLRVVFEDYAVNSATKATLKAGVVQRADDFSMVGGERAGPALLDELEFSPSFSGKDVVWTLGNQKALNANGVAEIILESLFRNVKRETEES